MLYNIIRDFFVQHVWGGRLSNGTLVSTGTFSVYGDNGFLDNISNQTFLVPAGFANKNGVTNAYIPFADWLSTTSTIITMIVMLICIAYFIRWIFKVSSNMLLLR